MLHLSNDELWTIAEVLGTVIQDYGPNEEIALLQDRIVTHLLITDYEAQGDLTEVESPYGTYWRIRDGLFEATGPTPAEALAHLRGSVR